MEIPHKVIEIWKQKENLVSPIVNDREPATTKAGDFVIIMDNAVWLQHTPTENYSVSPIFAKAVYSVEFVKINPKIFERIV